MHLFQVTFIEATFTKMRANQQSKKKTEDFRALVKSRLAVNNDTIAALAKRLGRNPDTISTALRNPDKFPILVAEIEDDLFPVKITKKQK